MNNFNDLLYKYAKVAIEVGLNLKSGQRLIINANIEAKELVRKLTDIAYDKGARKVIVNWTDEIVTYLEFKKSPTESLEEVLEWKIKGMEKYAEDGDAFLSITGSNPELLKDIDPKRINIATKAGAKASKKLKQLMLSGLVNWNVIAMPTKEWAEKVFPDYEGDKEEKLWEYIFKATRIDQDDPVDAWNKHASFLKEKLNYMNSMNFDKLVIKSDGTNLDVGLPEKHIWIGGPLKNNANIEYIPNIPTEEIFSTPDKTRVNGIVKNTKPLIYGGNKIDDFSLTIKNGKIVGFKAEQGEEILKGILDIDDGAKYFGEIALVQYDSPISNTGILFYNTLFDENASIHLAIGSSYPSCIEGGTKMEEEEFINNGGNVSMTHVDFMIGSHDTQIIGVKRDKTEIVLFENGNWII